MRLVRLSKDVFGFSNLEACVAFFEHVLPWNEDYFNIVGEGRFISKTSIKKNELLLFSFGGKIVSAAKVEEIYIDSDNRVSRIKLVNGSRKVFKKHVDLTELEQLLHAKGYAKQIVGAQGWNIIDDKFKKDILNLIIEKEWKEILE